MQIDRIILNYLNLAELGPEEAVRTAAAGGFRRLGIRLTGHRPGEPDSGHVGQPGRLAELARIAGSEGVELSSFATYRLIADVDPQSYLGVLDAAAALSIPVMSVNCFEPDRARAADLLGAVAGLAAQRGIELGLEFIPVSPINSIAEGVDLITRSGATNVGLNVDALHLARSGGVPADMAAIPEGRVHSIHLCDAPRAAPEDLFAEMRGGRLYPGEGELPLADLLARAPAGIEYEVEVPMATLARTPPAERMRLLHAKTSQFLAQHVLR